MAVAKRGDYDAGLSIVRGGLALALEHDLTVVAAELYQRLSVTLYESADYRRAEQALDTALELCRATPDTSAVSACVSCLAYVLRERGEWSRATEICRDMLASGDVRVRGRGAARRDPRQRGPLRLGAAAAHLVAGGRLAARALQHDRRHHGRARPRGRGGGRRPRTRPRAAAPSSPAGRSAKTATTRSAGCAGRPRSTRSRATAPARTPAPRRSPASRPRPATRTRWRRSRPRSPRPR